jgi:fatty acid desaturase
MTHTIERKEEREMGIKEAIYVFLLRCLWVSLSFHSIYG